MKKPKELQRRIKNFTCGNLSEQITVEAYPKKMKHDSSDIDVLRFTIINMEGEKQVIDMTPDEALEIAGYLQTAAMFWIMNYKPYWDTFMKRKRELAKRSKRKNNKSK